MHNLLWRQLSPTRNTNIQFLGPTVSGTGYSFPVYYRINENPLDFNSSVGYPLVSNDGIQPTSSPYITWSPVGGINGTIIVSSGSYSQVFTNQALGDVNAWKTVPTPEGVSYTRHLRVLHNRDHLLIMGAGHLPPSTTNTVTVSVIDLEKSLKEASWGSHNSLLRRFHSQ
jgi:hypothetical protein